MLDVTNNVNSQKVLQQKQALKNRTNNVSYKGNVTFERTPDSDSYDGKKKSSWTGIAGGGLLAALLAFAAVCFRRGRGINGIKKSLTQRLKDGFKSIKESIFKKAEKTETEAAEKTDKKWTQKIKDWWNNLWHKAKKEKPVSEPPAEAPITEAPKPSKATKAERKARANKTSTEVTPEGKKTVKYDNNGIKTEVVEKDGVKTTTKFNKQDKPVEKFVRTEKEGTEIVERYNAKGKLKGYTETRVYPEHKNTVVRKVFDAKGKLKERQVIVPNNETINTTVKNADDVVTKRIKEYTKNGVKTTEIYEGKGNTPVKRILKNPDGSVTEVKLSDTGKPVKEVTKKNGKTITTLFEADGKTKKKVVEKLRSGEVRETKYANGRESSIYVNEGNGRSYKEKFAYGESGKKTTGTRKYSNGDKFEIKYDEKGKEVDKRRLND